MGAELYTYYPSLGVYVSNRIMSKPNEEPDTLFWIREYSDDGTDDSGVIKIGRKLVSPLITWGNVELGVPTDYRFFRDCQRLDDLIASELSGEFPHLFPSQRVEYKPVPERGITDDTTVVYQNLVRDLRFLFFEYVWPKFANNDILYEELGAFIKFATRMYGEEDIMPDILNRSNFFVVDDGSEQIQRRHIFRFLDSNPIPTKKAHVTAEYCASVERRLDVLKEICETHVLPRHFWKTFHS